MGAAVIPCYIQYYAMDSPISPFFLYSIMYCGFIQLCLFVLLFLTLRIISPRTYHIMSSCVFYTTYLRCEHRNLKGILNLPNRGTTTKREFLLENLRVMTYIVGLWAAGCGGWCGSWGLEVGRQGDNFVWGYELGGNTDAAQTDRYRDTLLSSRLYSRRRAFRVAVSN